MSGRDARPCVPFASRRVLVFFRRGEGDGRHICRPYETVVNRRDAIYRVRCRIYNDHATAHLYHGYCIPTNIAPFPLNPVGRGWGHGRQAGAVSGTVLLVRLRWLLPSASIT